MTKQAILYLNVSPKSSKSSITINNEENVKVFLNSPPLDGRANAELKGLFSKKLHIARSNIIIDKGDKSRKKRILIEGMTNDEVMEKLRNSS